MKLLIDPLIWFFLALVVWGALSFWKAQFRGVPVKRWGAWLALAGAIGLYLASLWTTTAALETFVAADVEAAPPDSLHYLFVLGGGYHRGTDARLDELNPNSYIRARSAIRYAAKYPTAEIIVAGSGLAEDRGDSANAKLIRDALTRGGVDTARITLEVKSRTTMQHVEQARETLKIPPNATIGIVTDWEHMGRALDAFQAEFPNAHPLPTPKFMRAVPWFAYVAPTTQVLFYNVYLIREVVGGWVYAIRR
ncbi:MAG: hypothetical protein GF419_02665 [Ignavibacteriales bacterium]|nr:hypothetical protein [Ignavibacteriales bacterium]